MNRPLTAAQERALAKLRALPPGAWASPYELRESIPTLEGLVDRKYAVQCATRDWFFSPRTALKYQASEKEQP